MKTLGSHLLSFEVNGHKASVLNCHKLLVNKSHDSYPTRKPEVNLSSSSGEQEDRAFSIGAIYGAMYGKRQFSDQMCSREKHYFQFFA